MTLEQALEVSKTLNDICRYYFNKVNYTNREKVKQLMIEKSINWEDWKKQKKIKKNCLFCGKELNKRSQKNFCSSSCATSYNNLGVVRNGTEKNHYCLECDKKLTQSQNKFCSIKCQLQYNYESYIKKWKNGEENGLKGEYGISNYIRHYLIEKNNKQCQLCGWNELNIFTNKIPLEVHHIDGNYLNNNEENLQILCPNCHALTNTYKSANKKGRKGRKKQ